MASLRRTLSPAANSSSSQPQSHRVVPISPATRPRQQVSTNTSCPSAWRRRPIPCFLLCFLLGFVGGLFPFAHRHLQLDLPSDDLIDHNHKEIVLQEQQGRKLLLVVTPTYARPLQAYYLRRLAETLRLVPPPLLWVVVEMGATTPETAAMLRDSGVMYRHLACAAAPGVPHAKDRGVLQRNAALDHIERHRLAGILYFADDDNVYSLELFDRLRDIRSFGTWPVAMLAESKSKTILEGPVCNGSRVIGWHTNEKSTKLRRFHVDMSGFAFNSTMLWDTKRRIHQSWNYIRQLDTVKEGFQETTFIEQLVEDETQMEGIPPGCSRIMNYHLHLEAKDVVYPKGWQITQNLDVVIPLK